MNLLVLILAVTTTTTIVAGPEAQKQGIKKFKITRTDGVKTDPDPWPQSEDGPFGPTTLSYPVPYTANVTLLDGAGAISGSANVTYKPADPDRLPILRAGYDVNFTRATPAANVRLHWDDYASTFDLTDDGITVTAQGLPPSVTAPAKWKYSTNWKTYFSGTKKAARVKMLGLLAQMLEDLDRTRVDALSLRSPCEKNNPGNPSVCGPSTCVGYPWCPIYIEGADRAEVGRACAAGASAPTDALLPVPDASWCDGPECRGASGFARRQMACRLARFNTDNAACCQTPWCLGCCDSVANRNGSPTAWCESICLAIPQVFGDAQTEFFCMASTDRLPCSAPVPE